MTRFLAACVLLAVVSVFLPYRWTHEMDAGCHWQPRPWIGRLGAQEASGAALDDQAVCRTLKGLKSATPVRVVLTRWP